MKKLSLFFLLVTAFCGQAQTFRISIADSLRQQVVDGRLLLFLSKNKEAEPRNQINDSKGTQLVFGIDVNQWQPKSDVLVDIHAYGYPIEKDL